MKHYASTGRSMLEGPRAIDWKLGPILVAWLAMALVVQPSGAEIAEPQYLLYGSATLDGQPLPAGTPIILTVDGEVITTFDFGDDRRHPDLYALRIPLDTVGERRPGFAREGDAAQIFVDGQPAATLIVGSAGGSLSLDLDPNLAATGLFIADAQVFEGDTGPQQVRVDVSVTQASSLDVEVDFATRNDTATSPSDYAFQLGRAVIPAGDLSTTVTVQVAGDTVSEADESFFIDLTNPLNAVLLDPEGSVTILDDDTLPTFSIVDATFNEPNPDATQTVEFLVHLSHAWDAAANVSYAAVGVSGGAVNGSDFLLDAGTVTIAPGDLTAEIEVILLGDRIDESDETFEIHLAGAMNATILDGVGQGTITDYVRILRWLEQHTDGDVPPESNGPVQGLAGTYDVALSPDGLHLYVAGRADDALVVFERSEDGQLSYLATYQDGVDGVTGLDGVEAILVSSDGDRLFAASFDGNAVASFARQPDGTLVFVDAEVDGELDADSSRTVDGLQGATGLAEAPAAAGQPSHLYVAGFLDDAVAVFSVLEDGSLEYETVVLDDVLGADGLGQASSLAVSDDGAYVYVTGFFDDAIAVFSRNPTDGFLSFREIHRQGVDGILGLDGALDIAMSPDGAYLYVAGQLSHSVVAFARDGTTGALTHISSLTDGVGGTDGLRQITDLAFSHDPSLGDFLYATGFGDDAVAVLERQSDGSLLYLEQARDGVGGVQGLDGANALIVSPDDQNVYVAGSVGSTLVAFERDIVAPEPVLSLISTSHSPSLPSSDTSLDFRWGDAFDEGFGVGEYWLLLDTSADTEAPVGAPSLGVIHSTGPYEETLEATIDSDSYYLHLTTCDLIGNCGPTHLGPFSIDTTPPLVPSGVTSPSHPTPTTFPFITLSWEDADDPVAGTGYASGVAGYSWQFSTTNAPQCDSQIEGTLLSTTSENLAAGSWYFHICAVDMAGNAGPVSVSEWIIEPDLVAPSVSLVDTVARTDSGVIAEGDDVSAPVTQLMVGFSERMLDGSIEAPESFVLAKGVGDDFPGMTECDEVALDGETLLTVDSVLYDPGPSIAYLGVNGGVSLPSGNYRLLVCPSLSDLQGNPLNGGPAFLLDFHARGSFLLNPNFDTDLSHWVVSNHSVASRSSDDADGVPTSGSLELQITDQGEEVAQCVDNPPLPAGLNILILDAHVRVTENSATPVRVHATIDVFDQADCSGNLLDTTTTHEVAGDTGGLWDILRTTTRMPSAAGSIRVSVSAIPDDETADATVHLDRVSLRQDPALFTDDFESGNTENWSTTQ